MDECKPLMRGEIHSRDTQLAASADALRKAMSAEKKQSAATQRLELSLNEREVGGWGHLTHALRCTSSNTQITPSATQCSLHHPTFRLISHPIHMPKDDAMSQ